MKKAVTQGVIGHVSATQITNFVSCKRLWYLDKIAGIKPPQSKAQFEGDQLHQMMDGYYKEGSPIVHEGLCEAVTKCLPPAGAGALSEHPHDYGLGIFAADVPVMGRIDLLHFPGPRTPTVYDLKTKSKSSFKRFILTPEQLQENLQLIIYGKYCVEKHAAEVVTLCHLNVAKEGNQHKAVSTSLSRDDILHKYAHLVVEPVIRMKECAQLTSVDSLPTMEDAPNKPCWAYGGCPFREECFGVKTQVSPASSKGANSMFDEMPSGDVSSTLKTTSQDSLIQPATSLDFVLFIDCLPIKGSPVSPLEDLIAKHAKTVCEANKVTDVRELKFAVGTTALIALMKKEVLVGTYTVSSTGLGGLVSEALIPQARMVIRGVR
jgi:hypothetical protein